MSIKPIILTALALVPAHAVAASPDAMSALQKGAESIERKGEGSGVVGLVVQGGEMSSFSTRSDLTEQTPFEIASVSKLFTSLLLSVAVEEGQLGLEDPIGPQLETSIWMNKAARPQTAAITYKQLSTHHSGLPRLPSNLGMVKILANLSDPYAKYDTAQLAKGVAKAKPTADAGFGYSNFGTGLLGQLVSDTFGLPYCDAITDRIAKPLGMDSLTCEDASDLATPHFADGTATTPWHFQALVGAGGLRANAADLGRFLQHNMNPENAPELARALERSTTAHSSKTGLGWMRTETDDGVIWWHNGATFGSNSFVGFSPSADFGVVILMNDAADYGQSLTALGMRTLRSAMKPDESADESGVASAGE